MWTLPDISQVLDYISDVELRQYMYYADRANSLRKNTIHFEDEEMARILQIVPSEVKKNRLELQNTYTLIKSYKHYGERIVIMTKPFTSKGKLFNYKLRSAKMYVPTWRCPVCGGNEVMIQKYGKVEELLFGQIPSELIDEKNIYVCVKCGTAFRNNEDLKFIDVKVFIIPEQESAKRRLNWVVQKVLASKKIRLDNMESWKKLSDTAYAFLKSEWDEYNKKPLFRLHEARYTVSVFDLTDTKYFDRLQRAEVEEELEKRIK